MNNVTIIIPTLNEERYLPALLDSIANLAYEGNIQVIVVDAQSEDRTVDIAKSYCDKLEISVFHGPRDIGAQRNLGAKKRKICQPFVS